MFGALVSACRNKARRAAAAIVYAYSIRDLFVTDDAAPLVTPRIAEPGPGQWTVTDTGNRLSVSGGKLLIGGGTTTYKMLTGTTPRATGKALFFKMTQPQGNIATAVKMGFTIGGGVSTNHSIYHTAAGGGSGTPGLGVNSAASLYQSIASYRGVNRFWVILRGAGGAFFGFTFGQQSRLLWVSNAPTGANAEVVLEAQNTTTHTAEIEDVGVVQLAAPFSTDDFPFLISRTIAPANPQEATAPADCLVSVLWTPAGAAEVIDIEFRRVDANNCWVYRITQGTTANVQLYKREAGVLTAIDTAKNFTFNTGTQYRLSIRVDRAHLVGIFSLGSTEGSGGVRSTYQNANLTYLQYATGVRVVGANTAELRVWSLDWTIPLPWGDSGQRDFACFGDSKTQEIAWQTQLLTLLTAVGNHTWLNNIQVASGGTSVEDAAAAIEASLATAVMNQPTVAFCNIGANNLAGLMDETSFKTNYLAWVDVIHTRHPGVAIYCDKPWRRTKTALSNTMAGWIDWIVTQREFLHHGLDERVWLENGDDGATYTVDGTHYSAAGQTKKAELLRDLMVTDGAA